MEKSSYFNHSGVGLSTSGNPFFYIGSINKLFDFVIFNSLRLNNDKIEVINRYLCDKQTIKYIE